MNKNLSKFVIAVSILASQLSFAALQPFHKSQLELKSIIDHPKVLEKFGHNTPIDGILLIDGGYEVLKGECFLQVDVNYNPAGELTLDIADEFDCEANGSEDGNGEGE